MEKVTFTDHEDSVISAFRMVVSEDVLHGKMTTHALRMKEKLYMIVSN